MLNDTYKSIATPCQGMYKEKGSKFLSFAFPIDNVEEVHTHIARIKKEYFDARHHCYAYVLGCNQEIYRFNDDGEPSGTAGRPIYGQILSKELSHTLVIVVRYFGGTKLGTSGLIQAYKTATFDALEQGLIVEKKRMQKFRIRFSYALMNEVMKIMKDENLTQSNHDFDQICELDFSVRQGDAERVCKILKKISVEVFPIV